jgi:hypothetical protein
MGKLMPATRLLSSEKPKIVSEREVFLVTPGVSENPLSHQTSIPRLALGILPGRKQPPRRVFRLDGSSVSDKLLSYGNRSPSRAKDQPAPP